MTGRLVPLVAVLAVLWACGGGESREAGKGVITETTNGVSARGRLVTTDSVPVVGGQVRAVIDADVPEAWNGATRAVGRVRSDGTFQVDGITVSNVRFYASARDARGRASGAVLRYRFHGDSDAVLPDLSCAALGSISGRYSAFDSAKGAIGSGWRLRVVVRDIGWAWLDSASWRFDSLSPGTYYLRVQKVDGIPGHETTLEQDSVSVP